VASSKAYLLALAVALAASATSLGNGFVYDDVPVIQKDQRIHSLHDLRALLDAPFWGGDYRNTAYRPATSVALALDWAVGGGRPFVFHATNVLLHLAVVALLLALASRVLAPGGALVAALWFAVHPIHVEAVANCVGLAELLAAAGYLGALVAYLADGEEADAGQRRGGRRAWLAFAVLASAAVAYGAKEHAITLPAILLLGDAWQARERGRRFRDRLAGHAALWSGVVALALGYLAARAHALGPAFGGGAVASGIEGESLLGRSLIMAPAALVWLRWMIWPVHLSADYLPDVFVPRAVLGAAQVAGVAAVAGLAAFAWLARRRVPGVTAGIMFTAITASVAANVVVPTGVLLAERLAYLPSVGVAICVGALWQCLPRGRFAWPATALVLALLAARTLERIPVWRDPQRFLAALVRDAPQSYRAHWALGDEAFKRGRRVEGEREMLAAIRIYPADPAVLQELAEQYLEAGLFAPAGRYFMAAYQVDTMRSDAVVRVVFALLKGGHPDSAASVGAAALLRFPDAPPLLIATQEAYLAAARPREALALARRLVYLVPGSWRYQQLASYAAASAGRCDEARARIERAIRLAPAEPAPRDLLRRLDGGLACGLEHP
jgi:tetratricopeptide (TPR) repeat protein